VRPRRVPLDVVGIHASLHDEVLQQVPHLVVDEGRDYRSAQAKAFAHAAGHVVLTAAFPEPEVAGGTHPPVARVEPQHDLA